MENAFFHYTVGENSDLICKALSLLEACFDLISGSSLSMKIQIIGRNITENLGFKSSLRKVKKILFFFSFHFQILHTILVIFDFKHFLYLVLLFRNQVKNVENSCFY